VSAFTRNISWPWSTILLSLVLATGYCVIAVNWYFQRKLSKYAEAHSSLKRLRTICAACAICGYSVYAFDASPLLWRAYDGVLLGLVYYTWSFVCKVRGLGLVSARLAQIDELERAATKYRQIAELLPQIVWTATGDGCVDFSNERWRAFVGDERTWLQAVYPSDQPRAADHWQTAVATRQPMTLEVRLSGLAGYRTFIVKAVPIVQGEQVKWLGACADIEDQKLLATEKEMQARQKSFFLNALSHDLRAPLHNVLLSAHLLKMQAKDEADLETLNVIVQNAVAAGDLVTKLLDLAKTRAQDDNAIEPVALPALLRQITARFQVLAEQKGLDLRVAIASDEKAEARLVTDRHKLERILTNLVDNAIKYTNNGGVRLALTMAMGSGRGSITVSDTGRGIPRENIPYLFDEFYQVNNHERDRTKGFGMGLAICKCLARQLGGDVQLASTGSHGSCFEVSIADLSPGCGGRPSRKEGDLADSQALGLCRV
jgi:signal transduction histidine kinase